MPGLNINDEGDLTASLRRWKRRLEDEDRKTKNLREQATAHEKLAQRAKAMIARRRKQLKDLANRTTFGDKIVAQALKHVGTTESPANSNRGPLITAWQERFGLKGGGYPWCGAFAGAMVEQAGGDVTNRIVYTPYIREDAVAGRNGLASYTTDPAKAKVGDLVLFNFPGGAGIDHVGILRAPVKASSGTASTVEGNTSAGTAGSQANGGGVYLRTRPLAQIVGYARPKGA